ncbi:MAG: UDP-2,3-diacylglucosamine diphosphatase [Rhodocyclaceae bacterium]|nr:UDP-2,3-diacylglucosamine diphosphatase [Rhodocyclaceae bacterium]
MTGTDLFIADLHLSEATPASMRAFTAFMTGPARHARRLFILGDLFEYWAGDDDLDAPLNRAVCTLLRDAHQDGLETSFLAGNRDFLIGADFCRAAHVTLATEPLRITVGDTPALLMHGDALCTDDTDYQTFRAQVRAPAWQAAFLAKPLAERKAIIEGVRAHSERGKQNKPAQIMDVNPGAVADTFRQHGVSLLIHGHTHRPATHRHTVDGLACTRWVLSDWHGSAPYLQSRDGVLSREELLPA